MRSPSVDRDQRTDRHAGSGFDQEGKRFETLVLGGLRVFDPEKSGSETEIREQIQNAVGEVFRDHGLLIDIRRWPAVRDELDLVLAIEQRSFDLLFLEIQAQRRKWTDILAASEVAPCTDADVELDRCTVIRGIAELARQVIHVGPLRHNRVEVRNEANTNSRVPKKQGVWLLRCRAGRQSEEQK